MDYETTRDLLLQFPDLYLDDVEVLYDLFLVLGSGYRWINGELVELDTPQEPEAAREHLLRQTEMLLQGAIDTRRRIQERSRHPSPNHDKVIAEYEHELTLLGTPEYIPYARERRQKELARAESKRKQPEVFKLYEGCALCKVPDDVTDDWLAAAYAALEQATGCTRKPRPATPETAKLLRKIRRRLDSIRKQRNAERFGLTPKSSPPEPEEKILK
jgi:hypothetical protein